MFRNHLLALFAESNLNDQELWQMINQCLVDLEQKHPGSAEFLMPLITELMLASKFEMEQDGQRTVLMMASVVLYSPFKTKAPPTDITEEQAQKVIHLLKKHYLNEKARVVIYPRFLTATEAATYAPDEALAILKSMSASRRLVFQNPYGQLPVTVDPDPILQMEAFRQFGLYVRHLLFTVTVPVTERVVTRPYTFVNPLSLRQGNSADMVGQNIFEVLFDIPNTNATWHDAMSEVFANDIEGFNAIFAEPASLTVADRDSEFLALMPRLKMLVENACDQLHVEPSELCASIAHYREPEDSNDDPTELSAEAEARICLALKSSPDKPFTGDLITMFEGYFPAPLMLATISGQMMRQQVIPRLHMMPQDFAYVEDDSDLRLARRRDPSEPAPIFDQPVFLDFNGTQTTLFPVEDLAHETKHLLYS